MSFEFLKTLVMEVKDWPCEKTEQARVPDGVSLLGTAWGIISGLLAYTQQLSASQLSQKATRL